MAKHNKVAISKEEIKEILFDVEVIEKYGKSNSMICNSERNILN